MSSRWHVRRSGVGMITSPFEELMLHRAQFGSALDECPLCGQEIEGLSVDVSNVAYHPLCGAESWAESLDLEVLDA